MELILISLAGYLIGAIPFAYVIGKLFYRTDVREHGSGNLGGTNTGRVLGKKAGVEVMTLDLLKVTLVVFLAVGFCTHPWAVACGGSAAALGHCYPVFVRFRGGKAVDHSIGYKRIYPELYLHYYILLILQRLQRRPEHGCSAHGRRHRPEPHRYQP